jgi:glutamate dehydrogenase/leucine dehydrogenase
VNRPATVFDHPEYDGHERVTFVHDDATGLRAINAIHVVRGGTAGGGVRFRDYPSDEAALTDVLRLSVAMTNKMVLAGLPMGGAKSVIIGDPVRDKTPELLRAFGRFVASLGGRYTCGPDVGTDAHDMDVIAEMTSHVAGRGAGGGSTARPTALGVFHGLRAAAHVVFGSDDLAGRTIAVQGVGGVGSHLVDHLVEAGAVVSIADVDMGAIAAVRERHGGSRIEVLDPADVLFADVDVVSPNAIGGVLDAESIPRIRARVVCGSANNQLAGSGCAELLGDRGITWAPDCVVSVGGSIAGVCEVGMISVDERDAKLPAIYDTTVAILGEARAEGVSTEVVARRHAKALLAAEAARSRG